MPIEEHIGPFVLTVVFHHAEMHPPAPDEIQASVDRLGFQVRGSRDKRIQHPKLKGIGIATTKEAWSLNNAWVSVLVFGNRYFGFLFVKAFVQIPTKFFEYISLLSGVFCKN